MGITDASALAQVINLVRSGAASTRPQLEQASGLGRKVVTQRVDQAIGVGLLDNGDLAQSSGGRAPRQIKFIDTAGYIYVAQIGASEITAGITTLNSSLIDRMHIGWDIARGPDSTLLALNDLFAQLAHRWQLHRPWAVSIGVPGPVDFRSGLLVAPPIMPGWDRFSVRAWFRERYDAPVWVDNDVNLMALGEWHRGAHADGRDLLFIKVGTGIGAGLISSGRVYRGDTGAAGDIGHVQVTSDPVACRCGNTGCLEAVAGGWAIARDLTEVARSGTSAFLSAKLETQGFLAAVDVGEAVAQGDEAALAAVAAAARVVAMTVSSFVNFANPGLLTIGGGILNNGDDFVRVLAEAVLARSTRLATERLSINAASLDFREGLIGAGYLAITQLFSTDALPIWAEGGNPLTYSERLETVSAA